MSRWVDKYILTEYGELPHQRKCWGLIKDIYWNELGIHLPDFPEMNERDVRDALRVSRTFRDQLGNPIWIRTMIPHEFDVVVMTGYVPEQDRIVRAPIHAGVMGPMGSSLRERKVLHVEKRTNTVCVSIAHPLVRQRIIAFCRHAEVVAKEDAYARQNA